MQTIAELDRGTASLARTPKVLDALLRGLDERGARRSEGGETWSPFDVVGHLIHGEETDWIPRARIVLEHGEARPFDPYDRFAQMAQPKAATLDAELDLFAARREESLAALAALDLRDADLARTGTHPALGIVTLGQLLSTWVVHDLVHLRQVARLLALEQRGEVGAWVAYLPLLA